MIGGIIVLASQTSFKVSEMDDWAADSDLESSDSDKEAEDKNKKKPKKSKHYLRFS